MYVSLPEGIFIDIPWRKTETHKTTQSRFTWKFTCFLTLPNDAYDAWRLNEIDLGHPKKHEKANSYVFFKCHSDSSYSQSATPLNHRAIEPLKSGTLGGEDLPLINPPRASPEGAFSHPRFAQLLVTPRWPILDTLHFFFMLVHTVLHLWQQMT